MTARVLHPTSARGGAAGTVLGALTASGVACIVAASLSGCIDLTAHSVAAVGLDSMAAPSVVFGDTLRDTLGIARPLRGTAYDARGNPLTGVPVIYRILDPGVHVDSLTGVVVADSVPTSVRVLVEAGGIQTQPVPLFVVPAPDSIVALNPLDTLAYSLRDSTSLSVPLTAQLLHHVPNTSALDSVQAYVVSFQMQYPSDTLLAQLVDDSGHPSHVDTTAADGTAGRRIKLRPVLLSSATDSVVVYATARYHGTPVGPGPVRFVLQLRPGQ